MEKRNVWTLARTLFVLSCCAFGGGYAAISMMQKKFVNQLHWLTQEEMLDIIAIAQSCPGPLLVNAATVLGWRMAGAAGAAAAVTAVILPPLGIVALLSVFYDRLRTNARIALCLQVMQAGVAAVIVDVTWDLVKSICRTRRVLYILLMIAGFAGMVLWNMPGMYVLLACLGVGVLECLLALCKRRKPGCC